ncbi:MAG: hypothetical protein II905_08320, partial [Muribaculaceae bacterium]|nr:hypothetical protein [Muribaculaceae bacterium]
HRAALVKDNHIVNCNRGLHNDGKLNVSNNEIKNRVIEVDDAKVHAISPLHGFLQGCRFFHCLKMQSVAEQPFLHDENKKPEAEN